MTTKTILDHSRRVLGNYKNLYKLAKNYEGNFADHAAALVAEIDNVLDNMAEPKTQILVNWYCSIGTKRQTRSEMCQALNLTIDDYKIIMEDALLEFAKHYKQGVLETLP